MTTNQPTQVPTSQDPGPVATGFAAGATIAAAFILLTAGVIGLLQGIAAVAKDDVFVVGIEYTYKFDLTSWGWIHIVLGIIGILVAFGLFSGAGWARVMAILIASISIVANFLWLPYYPLWAILIIALDVVVIWAVATWRIEA